MGLDSPTIVRLLMAERSRLFAYTWVIVGDVHLAEDVFQEVSLLAVEKGSEVTDEPQSGFGFAMPLDTGRSGRAPDQT